eukprot:GHVT01104360.1.p1 GENE.GHVT01104360.1~~GHVT01104360.1.p1  ORF type:complete len:117 (+),score=57.78 GHVT01104360.1:642-992(+)
MLLPAGHTRASPPTSRKLDDTLFCTGWGWCNGGSSSSSGSGSSSCSSSSSSGSSSSSSSGSSSCSSSSSSSSGVFLSLLRFIHLPEQSAYSLPLSLHASHTAFQLLFECRPANLIT